MLNYKISKTGRIYKRKALKWQIECPKCSSKTQWVTRHLRQAHHLSKDEAHELLVNTDWYRRRNVTEPRIKVHCTVDGCRAVVVRLNDHLRNVHRISCAEIRRSKQGNKQSMRVLQVPNTSESPIPSSSVN